MERSAGYTVLAIGGYGGFGRHVSTALARDPAFDVTVAGRSAARLDAFVRNAQEEGVAVRGVVLDAQARDLAARIAATGARAVVHSAGPFIDRDYTVARACIAARAHYIDLADARAFVCGIDALDAQAHDGGVLVTSGASSVPALAAAVVDAHCGSFSVLEEIHHAIAPGNQAERGLATVRSILGYTGRRFTRWEDGTWRSVHGWGNNRRFRFAPPVGTRWIADCDVPDLELFPQRYSGVRSVTFGAGLELRTLHFGVAAMARLTRAGIVRDWARHAQVLLTASNWVRRLGTDAGAMSVVMRGRAPGGKRREVIWQLIAEHGDGPRIPAQPAILIARKLASGALAARGAVPCAGLFTLDEFTDQTRPLALRQVITVHEEGEPR